MPKGRSHGERTAPAQSLKERILAASREPTSSEFDRVRAVLSPRALLNNYDVIQELVDGQSLLPMIKANAYGHGAVWAARYLATLPGLYGLGLATFEEAAEIREALSAQRKKARLIVFSGAAPWSEQKGRFCEKHHLTPVIASEQDWNAFAKGGWASRIPYELKFNTGLNRLGISLNLAPTIARALAKRPAVEHPSGVFTHLVMSENAEEKLSQTQKEKFIWLKRELASSLPQTLFHLGNSGAIWNQKQWGLKDLTDVVRPGLALYGIAPWKGAPMRGLRPVMRLEAEVVHRHRLKAGDSVGYGATYKVRGSDVVHVATLAAGYADGIHRLLGGRGHVFLRGQKVRFLGRVSMDLCSVECPIETRIGDWAEILGENVDPWEQAQAAETIPYELLTSISNRVQRIEG